MRADPQVRKDGRCARRGCGKRLTLPKKHHSSISGAVYEREPFCSTECAKRYHGVKTSGISFSRTRSGRPTIERRAA